MNALNFDKIKCEIEKSKIVLFTISSSTNIKSEIKNVFPYLLQSLNKIQLVRPKTVLITSRFLACNF